MASIPLATRIQEPTPEQEAGWKKRVSRTPKKVRAVAERFDPWSLYKMKSTGERVTVASFYEDGTIGVIVSGEFNFTLFDREVFGVDPGDLEPCELPGLEERTGALMTWEQVAENIAALRVAVRPDLWIMGEDGKATRKQLVQ